MADDESERRRIIDRANRNLRQGRTLRKLADELRQESSDLRVSGKRINQTAHAEETIERNTGVSDGQCDRSGR